MRKYLLLATTAMLFAGNAMAGDIAYDGQSAIINVKANLHGACVITEVGDMDFKDIWLIPTSDSISLGMDDAGAVTPNSEEHVAKYTAEGTPGSFKIDCPDNLDANYSIQCAGNYPSGNCKFTVDQKEYGININPVEMHSVSDEETVKFGGGLTIPDGNVGEQTIDVPAVEVTLSY